VSGPPRPRRSTEAPLYAGWSAGPTDAVDLILARLNRVREPLDAKYGRDCIAESWPLTPPADVPPEHHDTWRSIPSRYANACAALKAAVEAEDVKAVQAAAERVEAALGFMDANLSSRGLIPATPFICEVEADGMQFGIIRDGFDWKRAAEARPDLAIRTAREVAVALAAMDGGLVSRAREAFPGAEVVASRPATATANEDLNDEILF
jgi:hypothetical protein